MALTLPSESSQLAIDNGCSGDGDNGDNSSPPPVDKESGKDEIEEEGKIELLTTALANLKHGFKRREASLKDQLENHKQALYELYASHVKVKKRLK